MKNVSYALLTGWKKKIPECQIMQRSEAKRKCVPLQARTRVGDRKMGAVLLSGIQCAVLVFVFILRTWASEACGIHITASFPGISPLCMGSLSPGPPSRP